MQRLRTLEMDCKWAKRITSLSELGWGGSWDNLKNLERLQTDFPVTIPEACYYCVDNLVAIQSLL